MPEYAAGHSAWQHARWRLQIALSKPFHRPNSSASCHGAQSSGRRWSCMEKVRNRFIATKWPPCPSPAATGVVGRLPRRPRGDVEILDAHGRQRLADRRAVTSSESRIRQRGAVSKRNDVIQPGEEDAFGLWPFVGDDITTDGGAVGRRAHRAVGAEGGAGGDRGRVGAGDNPARFRTDLCFGSATYVSTRSDSGCRPTLWAPQALALACWPGYRTGTRARRKPR